MTQFIILKMAYIHFYLAPIRQRIPKFRDKMSEPLTILSSG